MHAPATRAIKDALHMSAGVLKAQCTSETGFLTLRCHQSALESPAVLPAGGHEAHRPYEPHRDQHEDAAATGPRAAAALQRGGAVRPHPEHAAPAAAHLQHAGQPPGWVLCKQCTLHGQTAQAGETECCPALLCPDQIRLIQACHTPTACREVAWGLPQSVLLALLDLD